jgi:hypothetical protein
MPVGNTIGFGPLKGPDTGLLFGAGLVLAYTENGAIVNVSNGGETTTMQLLVSTLAVSNGICGFNLQGTASADLNLRVEVLHSGSVAATFLTRVKAGPAMVSGPFLLINIPAETANWSLRLRADGGTWTMAANLSSWWIESGAIEGGLVASDPSSTVTEDVEDTPHTVGETYSTTVEAPVGVTANEAVNHSPHTVVDSNIVQLVNTLVPTVGADDGYYSAATFNAGTTIIHIGNLSGDARGAFFRFELPQDLGGADIDKAVLYLTPDSNMATPVQVKVTVEYAPNPATITSNADAAARVRTVANLTTSVTATSGVQLAFNILGAVQELAAGLPSGGMDTVLVFVEDNGSPAEALLQVRGKEYGSTPPSLELVFRNVIN